MQVNQSTHTSTFASAVTRPIDLRMVGTVETVDGKFLIRSPYNAKALSFLQSLPHSQWLKAQSAWKCDATPYAAWKLGSVGLSLDIPAKFLCDRWEEGQLPPQVGALAGLLMTFKTTPWRHQQRAMAFALKKPAAMLALEMGCLAGDTIVSVSSLHQFGIEPDSPPEIRISDLYVIWKNKRNGNRLSALCYKESHFDMGYINDVVESGVKKVINLTLANKYDVKCTSDHEIAVLDGDSIKWVSSGSLTIGTKIVVDHNISKNADPGSAIPYSELISVEDCGEEMTYDIKMESPYHNFVANGIVVHNCGKTLTTICLLQAWQARMNLIICPKSVTGVWRREFGKHCGVSHQVVILEGSSKQKAAMLEQGKLKARSYGLNAFVINYESSWREFIGEALQSTMWDCVVCDESHRIKEMSSNQSKFAATLSTVSHRRLALTGTVMPRGAPIEVLGQYRFLEPALFGTKKSSFQDKFCNMSSKIPNKVDSYKNQEEFTETFSKIAFRIKSADVLTLPDIQQITIPVTLESKTRNYYEKMKKECIVELESGAVTAKNAAIKVMRLHQIACGHSKTEEGEIVRLGTEKQEVLLDMIEDIAENEPVVVFCKFIEDLRQIESVAKKLGRVYGEISGSRKDLTPNATMPENIQVMGVQVKAGGTGLDLTRARYAFWFSACDTWGDFDQANARIHRPGQTRPVVIYHLAATATVDIKIYRSLRNQQDIGLELLKSIDRPDDEV